MTQPGAHPACADAAAHVDEGLRAIRALDPTLRACIHVREDEASLEARDVDAGVRSGPLAGWTLAVKDNMDLAGTVRTDGLAPGHPPPAQRDATAVRRLRDAGAVVLAKTNLEALSLGATTQNPAWGACRNPWDLTRVPGGSSGGSAVAVAAGMVDAAVGTDTGGSVRNPAALCGISALRPTPGWIPTDGVTPLSPDFDVVGPMARSAGALRAMLAVLAGRPAPHRLPAALRGLRVGVPDEFFYDDLHPEVAGGCETLLDLLAAAGAALRPVRLRGAQDTPEALGVLANAQAADVHRALLQDDRVDPQVRDRLALGSSTTPGRRATARYVALRWRQEVLDGFEAVDLLVVPSTPAPAPAIGSGHLIEVSAAINRLNCAWTLAGVPVLALPCASSGLPVGAQLVGPPGADWQVLDAGAAIQRGSDWHERRPPISAVTTAGAAEPAQAGRSDLSSQ